MEIGTEEATPLPCQTNQIIIMEKKKYMPAPLDEKNVTTDWIEEVLPENPNNIAREMEGKGPQEKYAFYRFGVLWEVSYIPNTNTVYIVPMSDKRADKVNKMYTFLYHDVFGETYNNLVVDIHSYGSDVIVISFWWELESEG